MQARVRTHKENEKMFRDHNYLVGGTEAFSKMLDTESIERVTAEMASFDKQLRSCKTKTVNGVIIRPLKILYSLEIDKSDTCDKNIIKENNPNININDDFHIPNADSGGVND